MVKLKLEKIESDIRVDQKKFRKNFGKRKFKNRVVQGVDTGPLSARVHGNPRG